MKTALHSTWFAVICALLVIPAFAEAKPSKLKSSQKQQTEVPAASDPSVSAVPVKGVVHPNRDVVYRLDAFDKISVSVYGEPDLSTVQLIADDGTAFIPLIGAVKLGGQTVAQASSLIEHTLISQEYLRKPVVTVSIEEFSPKIITVMGEVANPGSVTITPGLNGLPIQMAIAGAGGFKNTSKSGAVNVTRAEPRSGEEQMATVDVDKLLQSNANGEAAAVFLVRPGDVVFVPRRVF